MSMSSCEMQLFQKREWNQEGSEKHSLLRVLSYKQGSSDLGSTGFEQGSPIYFHYVTFIIIRPDTKDDYDFHGLVLHKRKILSK